MPHYSVVCATLRESCCRNGYRSWPRLSAFLFSTDSLMPRFSYLASLEHKEKARESCPCLSRVSGSRIASPPKISNTEAHAHDDTIYYIRCHRCHGRQPLLYRVADEFARFEWPQIKRQSNVFSLCCHPTRYPSSGFGGDDGANLRCFCFCWLVFLKNVYFCAIQYKNGGQKWQA